MKKETLARFEPDHPQNRRQFLSNLAYASALFAVPGAFAEQLTATPALTWGPFYPDRLPLDTDNDLLVINDSITPAVGAVTQLSGRILDSGGSPIRNALVEIWQVDNNAAYIHTRSQNANRRDRNFQGFGRFETASNGEYRFRTIKPIAYPGRAPHIHFAVKIKGRPDFATQCHVEGAPENARDNILGRLRDPQARAAVIVPFVPLPGSRIGELSARFDIVMGFTSGL
jgi:protocatechuate 3,4-dioxygenase beta subunit